MDIGESLSHASAQDSLQHGTQARKQHEHSFGDGSFKRKEQDWVEEMSNALMIVASLIATVAFQVGVNPPGGFYQETKYKNEINTEVEYKAGDSVVSHNNSAGYGIFLMFNTIALISSLSIILLLISGLPMFKRKVFMWILIVIMWLAITMTAVTYVVSIILTTTSALYKEERIGRIIIGILIAWVALIAVLILAHLNHFTKIVKNRRK